LTYAVKKAHETLRAAGPAIQSLKIKPLVAQCAQTCSQCMSQLKTYTRIAGIACKNFEKACGGKDPEHLQAPSAHELAWSHALTLARDAEAEHLLCSDKRHKNKASFGSLCEAYLSAFALMLALWLDPACSPGDKKTLEKYMSKVAPKLDRIGQGKEFLDLCKVLIPLENSPWLNA